MSRLLTPAEVADRLSIKPETVRLWIRQGRIPAVKLGRVWRVKSDVLVEYLSDSTAPDRIARHKKALDRLGSLGV